MPAGNERATFSALLRQHLAPFIRKSFATVDPGAEYRHNWHIDLIAEYLEACTRREIKRLIINIPPRYMKSICTTVAWPAWLLGKNPSEQIVAASYAEMLALKHSVDCRLVIQSDWYRQAFPSVQLTGDQNEKRKFVTTARGHRFATSVGGTATGEGGRILIVDDPLSALQAASEVMRKAANDWFDQTFSSRLNDKENGVIVVVMQRLHEEDLTGHLLKKGGWEHLCIPAVAETRTVIDFGRVKLTREPGDVLHPERESAEAIGRQKIAMGSIGYAGQYQQRPTPAEGGVFKLHWLGRYDKPRETYRRITQSWDTAYKKGQENDPSCCLTWGEHDEGHDLLHALVARMEYPELKATLKRHAEAWSPDAVLIEDKASGQSLLQDARKESKLPVIAMKPLADKLTRAMAVSAMVEAGRVRLPRHAAWLTDFESEMMHFPNGAHDDQVDALSQYLAWIRGKTTAMPRIRSV